jgi:hypothetical protein
MAGDQEAAAGRLARTAGRASSSSEKKGEIVSTRPRTFQTNKRDGGQAKVENETLVRNKL